MSLVAVFLPMASAQQLVRVAVRDRHELVLCDSWDALLRTCIERPIRVAVVDLYGSGQPELGRIRQLRARHPRMTIVLYVTMTVGRAVELFEAARLGADSLLIFNHNDSAPALLGLIERAESKALTGVITRSLGPSTDPLVREALLLAVDRAHERTRQPQLARLLAVRPSTLRDRLAASGFPAVRRLVTWARLMAAAHVLEDENWSVDRVAVMHGFASGSAFRNVCQRYLHATPTEIRSRGGAAYVLRSLLRELQRGEAAKPARRSRRSPVVIF